MRMLLKNISSLVQVRERSCSRVSGLDMQILPVVSNAYLAIESGYIVDYGSMGDWEGISDWRDLEIIDCSGKIVMPAFCDSHSHLVYAGNRHHEFVDRIKGLSYQDIAARGGGILNSAQRLRKTSEEELLLQALKRAEEVLAMGTGAIEIKSGYGLDVESELKILRVIQKLKELTPLTVKATFLGAHAIPAEYSSNRRKYIDIILSEMLPAVAEDNLADFCDVFCEDNYFTPEETIQILEKAKDYGLKPKVHANQMGHSGGIKAGVSIGAVSVDHLEYTSDEDISILKNSDTIATLLPGAQFFLQLPAPPARKMIDNGLTVALATDYNPGSSPTGNMFQMMSFACILYKMLPEEAINAATINGAAAMGVENELGTISTGKKANLLITKEIPDFQYLPYAFGSTHTDTVILNGKMVKTTST